MPGFYYLVLLKGYPKEENTGEPLWVVIYFRKLINIFHKENPEKLTATSLPLDFTLSIARPLIPKELKQKYDYLSKKSIKEAEIRMLGWKTVVPFIVSDMRQYFLWP